MNTDGLQTNLSSTQSFRSVFVRTQETVDKNERARMGRSESAIPVVDTRERALEQALVVRNLLSRKLALAHGHVGIDGLGDGRCLDKPVGSNSKCYSGGSNKDFGEMHSFWEERREEERRWKWRREKDEWMDENHRCTCWCWEGQSGFEVSCRDKEEKTEEPSTFI